MHEINTKEVLRNVGVVKISCFSVMLGYCTSRKSFKSPLTGVSRVDV